MNELQVSAQPQPGVINWNFEEIKARCKQEMETYKKLVFTDAERSKMQRTKQTSCAVTKLGVMCGSVDCWAGGGNNAGENRRSSGHGLCN